MRIDVAIKQVATGKVVRYSDDSWKRERYRDIDHAYDCVNFMFTDGNYGCDCNRELLFYRNGEGVEPEDVECGRDAYLVNVKFDGGGCVREFSD